MKVRRGKCEASFSTAGLWCVSVCISDLGDVVDGGLHAPQLRGLDVQQLQYIVG